MNSFGADNDNPEKLLAFQWLERLEQVGKGHEAIWGVGVLTSLAAASTRLKWDRQWSRLSAAVMAADHAATIDLAAGLVRGWGVLVAEAEAGGHKPSIGDAWECRWPSGASGALRVVRTLVEGFKTVPEGTVVYTLEEVARIIESRQLVNVNGCSDVVENDSQIKPLSKGFFEGGGEELPL